MHFKYIACCTSITREESRIRFHRTEVVYHVIAVVVTNPYSGMTIYSNKREVNLHFNSSVYGQDNGHGNALFEVHVITTYAFYDRMLT